MNPKILFISLFFVYSHPYFGQTLGHVFKKEHFIARRPIPYVSVTERDVMWSKRVWRVMDLREKMNHPYYYPIVSYGNMNSLFTLIYNSIDKNELTVYDAITDQFTVPLSRVSALAVGEKREVFSLEDEDGIITETEVVSGISTEVIMRFRIKEDWFFDRQRSVMDVRIIGICPVAEVYDENGDYKGELPLYWIYFPEIRPLLAQQETVNRWNDAEQRSYDELFAKRFFSSYVYKESNVYDRKIGEYKIDLEALLEGQSIEEKVFNFEQDLWEY